MANWLTTQPSQDCHRLEFLKKCQKENKGNFDTSMSSSFSVKKMNEWWYIVSKVPISGHPSHNIHMLYTVSAKLQAYFFVSHKFFKATKDENFLKFIEKFIQNFIE